MHKKYDVVVIGELNVDIILNNIENFPVIGKEIIAEDLIVTMGSSSAIFACNLSTLGTKVVFIGKVGYDAFANLMLDSLATKKVDTSKIIKTHTFNTGATIVLNYDQDRANITYPGAMNDLTINDIDFEVISNAKHLHYSSYFLQPGLKKDVVLLFKKAKELGLTTSIDPQWDPFEKWDMSLEELLPFTDVFFPNKAEILALTATDSIENAIHKIKHLSTIIAVKNGNEGAVGWNGQEIIYQKAFLNKKVVDCIGAGDSFNAGFIHEFINHHSVRDCLKFGALTGAINTTEAGGTKAFEDIEKIRSIAKVVFNYQF